MTWSRKKGPSQMALYDTPRLAEGLEKALAFLLVARGKRRWQCIRRRDRWLPNLHRQVEERETLPLDRHKRVLDRVAQFTDIPRPRIGHQTLERIPRYASDRSAVRAPQFLDEVVDEQGEVFAPLPQRRELNGKDVNAIIKILAERAGGDQRSQVFIGRRHQADIDPTRTRVPDPLDLVLLQHTEEF